MADWVMVAGDFVPTGGMDVGNLRLAQYLARTGHTVEVVTHRAAAELSVLPGVTVTRVPKPLGSYLLGGPLLRTIGLRRAVRSLAAGGRTLVNGGNCPAPDVNWVHYVHAAYRPAVAGRSARRLKGWVERRQAVRWERAAVSEARLLVCNSRRTATHVIELLAARPDRVRVIYYGIDADRFMPVTAGERVSARATLGWPERPWALFIGGLGDRRKGFDTLYEAWRQVCGRPGWDAALAVVGQGADLPIWQAQAASDGLSDRVRFLGFRKDVPTVIAACDLLIHPARYEAYGLGVHEALCRGVPAVVSAYAGVAERYPADLADLLLADPEDATGLADRLWQWQTDPDGWRSRVAGFADALRGRSWNDMAGDIVATAGDIR